jgi:hypothetical protein
LLLAALPGLVACDSRVFGPEAPGEDYVLRSIADIPLPAPWTPNPGLETRMMSAGLRLNTDGTGTWHAVVESELMGPTYEQETEAVWESSGGSVEVTLVCDDLSSCIAGPHLSGEFTETGIRFSHSVITRAPLVFDAVR